MGVNKVIYGGETLVDMTGVTVTPETLLSGETALDASGELITGTASAGGGGELDFVTGTFSTTNSVIGTINVSGLGFTPKQVDVFVGKSGYSSYSGTSAVRYYLSHISGPLHYNYAAVRSKSTTAEISFSNGSSNYGAVGLTLTMTSDGFTISNDSSTKYTYSGLYSYVAYR